MTKQEWAAIVADIQATWPSIELKAPTVAIWFEDVEDLDAAPVAAAAVSYRREGAQFAPTGGMLRKRAAELAGTDTAADPDKGWALVQEAIRRFGGDVGLYLGDGKSAEPASVQRERWLEERDPVAAEAARIVGWDFLRGTGPDEYHEPSVLKAFRESYRLEQGRERTRRQVAELGVGKAPRKIGDVIAGALEASNETKEVAQ